MTPTPSELDLRTAYAGGVFFFSPENLLSHNSGCLIEGLLDLGIKVRANTADFTSRGASWPLVGVDTKALVSKPFAGLSAFVVDITHTNSYVPLDSVRGGRIAYVTNSDMSLFCRVPEPYALFAVHDTRFAKKPGRRFPLAFGPSNGLIAASEKRLPFAQRKRVALRNFRPSFGQGVRGLLDMACLPHLKNAITCDSAIQETAPYLDALCSSTVCLAYGGEFYNSMRTNTWLAEKDPNMFAYHTFEHFDGEAIVMRWDSWRFWESLVCGCLTVHLDFVKYGFNLPVMPKPWVHYAPIDLDDLKGSADALMDREKQWPEIAEAGRCWAIEHYAPKPTVLRVLGQML